MSDVREVYGPRPAACCGKCPPIEGGGYDCTCEGNPRCVRERVRDVFVNAERRESFGGTDIDALTDAVLAAVGQGVTVEWGVGYGDRHEAAPSREGAEAPATVTPTVHDHEWQRRQNVTSLLDRARAVLALFEKGEGAEHTPTEGEVNRPRGGVVMTARETTLGALTAADLGKRVRVGGDGQAPWEHTLAVIVHRIDKYMPQNTTLVASPDERVFMGYVTTPVTIYDEEGDRG